MSESAGSAYQQAIELIGRRWCGAVAKALLGGPLRFSELERQLPSISARLLTQRLRDLEREGIVRRETDASAGPVAVRYTLTEKGRALERVIDELDGWARDWLVPAAGATRSAPARSPARTRRA